MYIQHSIKIFLLVEDLRLFPYFGFGVASVSKNLHLASQGLDLVGVNPCAKNYQSISTVSRAMCIFAYCHILASALPPSRKRKSGIWRFLPWTLSVLMCTQSFNKISQKVEDLWGFLVVFFLFFFVVFFFVFCCFFFFLFFFGFASALP